MNTHVFIVNGQTFKYHLEYMFAGTGASEKKSPFLNNPTIQYNATAERNLMGMIADISRIQIGDNIIFTYKQPMVIKDSSLEYSEQNLEHFSMKMILIIT